MNKTAYILSVALITATLSACSDKIVERDLNIVPYPKQTVTYDGDARFDIGSFGIKTDATTAPLAAVVRDDLYRLTGIAPRPEAKTRLSIAIDTAIARKEYRLSVKHGKAEITGGSYQAAVHGWSTLLQAANIAENEISFPKMLVSDSPDLEYRGMMIDLARSFHNYQIVLQTIDLCRWYKISYLQLHLSDDQSYMFPSKAFPCAVDPARCYTEAQIREIVDYAAERGVELVPEIEGPGHSSFLRNVCPDVFGQPDFGCTDMASPIAVEAMKTLTGEVIDAFPNSHFIHIGADEVNLEKFKNLPHVKKAIKERGFDDAHDLYLAYINEMHDYIRSRNRQTCLWEGFDRDGSAKVKIPKDVLVFEFETMYQRPDSLVSRGYNIINTSWLPIYITQGMRWTPKEIYDDWNYYTWKHWWDKAPASKAPIVIDEQYRKQIKGVQMCAWELDEEMEYPALCRRLAAVSERAWDTIPPRDYDFFALRLEPVQDRIRHLLYPLKVEAVGLTDPNYVGNRNNRENFFSDRLTVSISSLLPSTTVRYTTDGTFPTATATIFNDSLTIDKSTYVKTGLYDEKGRLISYYPVFYEKKDKN
jgi:hexosaminidase